MLELLGVSLPSSCRTAARKSPLPLPRRVSRRSLQTYPCCWWRCAISPKDRLRDPGYRDHQPQPVLL